MKKTLTALTLTSIAVAAVAAQGNTNSTDDVNLDKNKNTKNVTNSSGTSKDEKVPSLANININLPTGGAKPLSKIDSISNTTSKSSENTKTRKGEEISILPLPSDVDSKTSDFKIEIKKEEKQDDNKSKKNENSNTNNTVNKDSTVKKTSQDKVNEELNKPMFIDKKNDKKSTNDLATSNSNTNTKSSTSTSTSNTPKNVAPNNTPAMSIKEPTQVIQPTIEKEIKDKKIEVKDIKKNSAHNDTIKKETKDSSDNKEKAKVAAAASAATAAIIAKEIPLESKDVKTEVTLDKKEPINNIQHVPPKNASNPMPNLPAKSNLKTDLTTGKTSVSVDNKDPKVHPVPERVEIKKKTKIIKKQSNSNTTKNTNKVITPNVVLPSVIVIDKENSIPYSISSSDVNVDVLFNPNSKKYLVKFDHKKGNSFRDSDFTNILLAEGKNSLNTPILFAWTNSTLKDIKIIKSNINPDGEYLLDIPQSKGKCEAFYVTYKLANDVSSTTKSIILDSEGHPSQEMDRKCDLPQVLFKEDIIHSKHNYVLSTTINSPVGLVDKPVKFTSTVSFEGQEINPSDLRYIILSEDFTNFYYSIGNTNVSPALGTTFTQKINTSGTHYFTSIFNNEKGDLETSTVKKYISK